MHKNKLVDAPVEGALFLASLGWIAIGLAGFQTLAEEHRIYANLMLGVGIGIFVLSVFLIQNNRTLTRFSAALGWISERIRSTKAQLIYTFASMTFTAIAVFGAGSGGKMISLPVGVGGWLLAIFFIVLASIDKNDSRPRLTRGEWLYMGLFFGLALLIHGLFLEEMPTTFQGDEGSVGVSALNFIRGNQNNIFSVGWFSFPGLYFWVQGQSIRLFGQTIFASRLPSVIASAIITAFTYLIGKKMYNHQTGLIAAIFLSGFHFFNHFSRLGLNNIWDAVWVPLALFALWYGWERENSLGFILAGLAVGMGQFFYVSSRLLVALIPLWLVIAAILRPQKIKPNIRNIIIMVFTAFVVLGPMIYYFQFHFEEFMAPINRVRLTDVWFENNMRDTGATMLQLVWEQLSKTVSILVTGGATGFYDSGVPVFRVVEAAAFIVGLLFLALKPKDNRSWLLILWLGLFTASATFSLPNPAVHRYVALSSGFALIFAVGVANLTEIVSKVWNDRQRELMIAALVFTILVAVDDVRFYMFDYSPRSEMGGVNTLLANRIVDEVKARFDGDDDVQIAYLNSPRVGYNSIQALPFLTPGIHGTDYPNPPGSPENPEFENSKVIFIVLPEREEELNELQSVYPGGQLTTHYYKGSEVLFWMYIVDVPQDV